MTPAVSSAAAPSSGSAAVELFWLPLGAGGHCVRMNGRMFEACSATLQRRPRADLYHSALEVRLEGVRYVIEMAPVWNERTAERGVVAEGPVGHRALGRLRLFRYEIRCWPGGRIPDVEEAVDSPRCLSRDPACAARVLGLVDQVPGGVWGRDEAGTGDMWNSNSLVAWLIICAGLDAQDIRPPRGGRAPGWDAGLVVARRAPRS